MLLKAGNKVFEGQIEGQGAEPSAAGDYTAVQIIKHVSPKSRFSENREKQSQCLNS